MSDFNERYESLTGRERQVLFFTINAGLTARQMSKMPYFNITTRTIECHKSAILKKMKCKNFVQLAYEYGKNTK